MNFLRAELKKILDMTQYREEATYIGSCGYVRVNEDVRMRLEFSDPLLQHTTESL